MKTAFRFRYFLAALWVVVAGHVLYNEACAEWGVGDDNWITVYNQNADDAESNWLLHFKVSQSTSVLTALGVNLDYGVTSFMDIGEESVPIKEIYHEPRVYFKNTSSLPSGFTHAEAGWWHESNGGEANEDNRSWDRGYAEVGYELPGIVAGVSISFDATGWWIFDTAPENDQIIDVEGLSGRFGGQARLVLDRKGVGRYVVTVGPSAYSIDWHVNTLPMVDGLETFLRYYDGDGESLLGYNENTRSIGFGVSVAQGGDADG